MIGRIYRGPFSQLAETKEFTQANRGGGTPPSLPLHPPPDRLRTVLTRSLRVLLCLTPLAGCRNSGFPDVPAGYREFAYVANGGSNTVTVLDLVYVRQDRTLQVGGQPHRPRRQPRRNEVYVVNSGSGTISVIDAEIRTPSPPPSPSTACPGSSPSTPPASAPTSPTPAPTPSA